MLYQCKHLAWTVFQECCAPSSPVTSAPALGEQISRGTKGGRAASSDAIANAQLTPDSPSKSPPT